ncbi:MAG: YcgL domain-containing protein [bacterium]
MKTWVYKGSRKADTYLYVQREEDFSRVPGIILDLMGSLELVLDIDLAKREKLAQADIVEVMDKLADQGFFLQMPPGDKQPDSLC